MNLSFSTTSALHGLDAIRLRDGLFGVETAGTPAEHVTLFADLYLDTAAFCSALVGRRIRYGLRPPPLVVEPYRGVTGLLALAPTEHHAFLGFIDILGRTFSQSLPSGPSLPIIIERPTLRLVDLSPPDDRTAMAA